jgi:hypothetical protein
MTSQERNARDYCLSIGADPDEVIERWWGSTYGGYFTQSPRWLLYIGAVIQHRHAAE